VILGFRLLVLVLLAFVLMPAAVAIMAAFDERSIIAFPPQGFSWRWFERALNYEDFQTGFVNSVFVAAIASTLSVIIGSMAAYAMDRYRFRGKATLEALLLAPLAIPHFTIGLGALILAAQLGQSRGWPVVILAHIVLVLPFVLRSLYVSLKNIDPRLELAALSLGAKPGRVIWTVTLPALARASPAAGSLPPSSPSTNSPPRSSSPRSARRRCQWPCTTTSANTPTPRWRRSRRSTSC